MKKLMLMAALLSSMVFAQFNDSEKGRDVLEYQVPNRAGSVSGDIDGSQTFNRRYLVSLDLTCFATSSDSINDGVGYQVFDLTAPGGEALEASTTAGTLSDSVMFIYCDFDPMSPEANLVFWDDDDGAGLMSAISAIDGVVLPAGTYKLVVSGYSSSDLGTYTLDVGGNYTIAAAGTASSVPTMSEWGMMALAVLLAMGGVLYLRRS
jgi:hypothetical protein